MPHFTNSEFKCKASTGGSILLLNKIKRKPLPVQGGTILSNMNVGITSNAIRAPQSQSMIPVVGGMIDFNKHQHVKMSGRSVQKKKDKGDENIKFVY
jgi:hypothetical protein